MLDKKLLIDLVSIQSSYNDDTDINNFIVDTLSKDKSIKLEKDAYGNIYATKGKGKKGYKCIVSHTDTVHSIKANRAVYEHNGNLFAMAESNLQYGSKVAQVGIGGDDKCGVYTCMKALSDFDNIKAVFFRFEESGCKGSNASNISYFNNCNFVIQCDRRNNFDFITHTNGIKVASEEFEKKMKPIYEEFGYSKQIGIATDVGTLKRRGLGVSAVNLSSGYFDPHTPYETINLKGLQNCYNLVTAMFKSYGDTKFEHKHVEPVTIRNFVSKITKKSMFKNSIYDNVLSLKEEDLVKVEYHGLSKLIEIGNTRLFKLIDDEIIYLDGTNCPLCGSKDSVMFSTYDSEFYCTNRSCDQGEMTVEAYKELTIEESGVVFVYDKLNDVWMVESESKWDEALQTYRYSLEKVY